MTLSETYRASAGTKCAAADATNVPNRKESHRRSAEVWDVMTDADETTTTNAAVTAAVRAA